MTGKLFETTLRISDPWFVTGTDSNAQVRTPTIRVDFAPGSRFAAPGVADEHPGHDMVDQRYRHLNVELAPAQADFSPVPELAIKETCAGVQTTLHQSVRRCGRAPVLVVAEGRSVETVTTLGQAPSPTSRTLCLIEV